MKGINKIALVVSKIMEVMHWLGAAVMAAMLVCSAASGEWFGGILSNSISKSETVLSVYGFELECANADGTINITAIILFSVGALIILLLMAMVFRNVYLIIKHSGVNPFQKDNIRMLREIGIFFIAVPVVGLIMSIISRLVLGAENAEMVVRIDGFAIGIFILCLTQFFARGAELQSDVDGLL